jgi:hypothetical protein
MKQCAYCGRDNQDAAVNCAECGTNEFKGDPVVALDELDPNEKFVTLTSCQKLVDADVIASRLGAAGIESFIPDQFLMQAVGFNFNTYGYVRLQVRQKDFESAKALLADDQSTALQ